jgi:DNA-binding LacI/PurR family transcriptional regulator
VSSTGSVPPRRPTLEEVAVRAGVGRGTVSRAINGSPQVSPRAREAVLTAIEELGYVPNRAARSLVTRRTDTVALVISESEERFFGEPFFAGVVRGVSAALASSPRQMVLAMAQSSEERQRLEHYLTGQHVDGVLLLSLHGDDPLPERLAAHGLPVVLGGRPFGVEASSWVDMDNVGGSSQATAHLLDAGRSRIATITGPGDMTAGAHRLRGYRQALAAAGVAEDEKLVVAGDFSERSGYEAMGTLLARTPDVDAVFAASDLMAVGAMRRLREAGRTVPDDVALVGFDDSPISRHTTPLLTTVHQPLEQMGRTMAEILVARIEGRDVDLQVTLATHLVVRGSA